MAEADVTRDQLRTMIQTHSHWLFAVPLASRPVLDAVLAAANAGVPPAGPKVRVLWLALDLANIDIETGRPDDLGTLLVVAIPKGALAVETLHGVLQATTGVTGTVEDVLATTFIIPTPVTELWRVGAQVQALHAWLGGAVEASPMETFWDDEVEPDDDEEDPDEF